MSACPLCGFEPPQAHKAHLDTFSVNFVGAKVAGPDSVKWMMDQLSKGFDPRKRKPEEDGDVPE
jgi:hypothetical protein